jgi:signal transduction histidine kinase
MHLRFRSGRHSFEARGPSAALCESRGRLPENFTAVVSLSGGKGAALLVCISLLESMLHDFIEANRAEIETRAAERGGHRGVGSEHGELDHGIPLFISQFLTVLEGKPSGVSGSPAARDALTSSATLNGEEQMRGGLSVEQVVHAYGDICQVVTELATEQGVGITTADFKTFNGCLDDATAHAVTEYVAQRERSLAHADTERLGLLAHEMRNHLSAAILSFESIRSGVVGSAGRTSEVHARSLLRLRDVIDRSLAEVRLDANLHAEEIIAVTELVEEVEVTASLHAKSRGIRLTMLRADPGLRVRGDRQTLLSVVGNLVQNAVKFTKRDGQILVRARTAADRVYIDVEDECGGLPAGKMEDLFAPFSQKAPNRSGLGLGLSICRRGAAANGGEICVRDLPGRGCVFTLVLPAAREAIESPAKRDDASPRLPGA